ncbi:MAG: acyl carrier protein [Clostridia bacterium]|nr:acyl carrier protein [Clostridia bacterium]MBR5321089.1 acyl carrier protein [Clostridia bacterium]
MVFEKVREIICDQLEVDEDVVTLDAILLEDLGADSIDLADLVMTFEDEFDMEISDEALENIKTVSDIVKFIEEN